MAEPASNQQDAMVGSVLVVGGGVGGVQASLDLADAGYHVYRLEQSPVIGGAMAQLDKTLPTNDCSMCILSPKLVECGRHLNIEIITQARVTGIAGEPGNFKVSIVRKPSYVDPLKCVACGACAEFIGLIILPGLARPPPRRNIGTSLLYFVGLPGKFIHGMSIDFHGTV